MQKSESSSTRTAAAEVNVDRRDWRERASETPEPPDCVMVANAGKRAVRSDRASRDLPAPDGPTRRTFRVPESRYERMSDVREGRASQTERMAAAAEGKSVP
jgi:hypothetical protein